MRNHFKGILICTDFDETFTSAGKIPQNNIDAVKRFMDLGGLFTFSSGRGGEGDWIRHMPIVPNAPMVGYSGSQIYDFETGSYPYYVTMKKDICIEALRTIGKLLPPLKYIEICVGGGKSYGFSGDTKESFEKGISRIEWDVLKVFCVQHTADGKAHEIPAVIRETFGNQFELTSNVPYSFEITMPGVHKGTGVARLRELIRPELLVCVGDYLGDIAMLKEADIGYAVENAHPAVREAADRVTVHSSKGAIAQIINDLENT